MKFLLTILTLICAVPAMACEKAEWVSSDLYAQSFRCNKVTKSEVDDDTFMSTQFMDVCLTRYYSQKNKKFAYSVEGLSILAAAGKAYQPTRLRMPALSFQAKLEQAEEVVMESRIGSLSKNSKTLYRDHIVIADNGRPNGVTYRKQYLRDDESGAKIWKTYQSAQLLCD